MIFVYGYDVVCLFVNDIVDVVVFEWFVDGGMWLIVLCLVGFNYVDFVVVEWFGIVVVWVFVYLLYVVVEYVVVLIFVFNCCLLCVVVCICEGDFLLNGLFGFDLYGKIVGVIGIGIIGSVFVKIMMGFGMYVFVYLVWLYNDELIVFGVCYVEFDELLYCVDIVSLYCLLLLLIYYLINEWMFV